MNKKIFLVAAILMVATVSGMFAQDANTSTTAASSTTQAVETQAPKDNSQAVKYLAAAIAVGIACIAGGMAVGKIGAAAMGAMSENADLSGKALPFVGLAEGICLWGFLVALLIIIL